MRTWSMAKGFSRGRCDGSRAMDDKAIYLFGGGSADGRAELKELLGGKGANLAEMARLGVAVPPGFTITTEGFAWDCYRRFVSMYGGVVLGLGDEPFDQIFEAIKHARHAATDSDLAAADLAEVVRKAKALIVARTGHPVPHQPREQLLRAIEA